LQNITTEARLRIALFLCSEDEPLQILFDETWLAYYHLQLQDKIDFIQSLYPAFSFAAIFPYEHELSSSINFQAFAQAYFIQPDIFIRLRQKKKKKLFNNYSLQKFLLHSFVKIALQYPLQQSLIIFFNPIKKQWCRIIHRSR